MSRVKLEKYAEYCLRAKVRKNIAVMINLKRKIEMIMLQASSYNCNALSGDYEDSMIVALHFKTRLL